MQTKGFAEKIQSEFQPTKLGLALIQGYHHIHSPLSNVGLRAEMEDAVKRISEKEQSKDEAYSNTL